MQERASVVLLASTSMALPVAEALARLPEVSRLTILTCNATGRARPLLTKLRDAHRYDGVAGIVRIVGKRLRNPSTRRATRRLGATLAARCPGATHRHVASFHAASTLEMLRELAADLGVVAGTGVLPRALFSVPRMGCVNLHLGRAPEFRGSSPGFYEMLQGVPEVGITIHRVTDVLDGGEILRQELFPLELAPSGDPVRYLIQYQKAVLLPNGARLMAETVAALVRGECTARAQDLTTGQLRRRATHSLKRELRRLVAARRAWAESATTRR